VFDTMNRSSRVNVRGSVLVGVAGALLLASAAMLVGYFLQVRSAAAGSATATRTEATSAEPATRAPVTGDHGAVRARVEAFLDREVVLRFEDHTRRATWRTLGAELDPQVLDQTGIGDSGELAGLVPVKIRRDTASGALLELKRHLDRPAIDARLDLEGRKVHPEVPGFGIDVYGSVSALETAARRGAGEVALEGAAIPASLTVEELGIDDISAVLGHYTTKFSINDRSRNDNLKLAASRIDGHVIPPGEVFSFNEVVGARSEEEGYKTAGVILQGEMVDGMAGGACQISTTVNAAAFFAGLDLVESQPHSRPSTYIHMGLDATVVFPQVDVKLGNPYDFPVAIHFRVARGEATVEILGRERPWDEVAFERDIRRAIPFQTITREDDSIPIGHMVVDQPGFPGYVLVRERKFYKGGEVAKVDRWTLNYRPVVEYVRMGVNPDPNLPPPKAKQKRGPSPASGQFRLSQ
jgi:vancomycin resistance protein YoaR